MNEQPAEIVPYKDGPLVIRERLALRDERAVTSTRDGAPLRSVAAGARNFARSAMGRIGWPDFAPRAV